MKVCDLDCFHCNFDDCINDEIKPELSEAQRWYKREYTMERRDKYRQLGICTVCYKRKAREGYASCDECAEKIRIRSTIYNKKRIFYKRETRAAEGKCYFCGNERAEGYKVCVSCLERCKKNTPTTRQKRSEEDETSR